MTQNFILSRFVFKIELCQHYESSLIISNINSSKGGFVFNKTIKLAIENFFFEIQIAQ